MSEVRKNSSFVNSIKKTFRKKTKSHIWNDEDCELTKHEEKTPYIKDYSSDEVIRSTWLWTEQATGNSPGQQTSEDEKCSSNTAVKSKHLDILPDSLSSHEHEQYSKGVFTSNAREIGLQAKEMLTESANDSYMGARPKKKNTSQYQQNTKERCKSTNSLKMIEEEDRCVITDDEEMREVPANDKTSDYGTMGRDDVLSFETGDDEYRGEFSATRRISCSVPDLQSKGRQTVDVEELKPLQKNYIVNVKKSKNVLIAPDKGTATINHIAVNDKLNSRHLKVLADVRETPLQVETELFKGGQKYLNRINMLPMVIFKGSGYGGEFAGKMLFERVVSAQKDDTKAYYLKHPDEMRSICHNEKAVILATDLNGPSGDDTKRLDGWYEVLKEHMAIGTGRQGNLTFILTLQDSDLPQDKKHPFFKRYSEYIVDALKKEFRPSGSTKEKLVEAFLKQKHLRVNPVKGGSPKAAHKLGTFAFIDKDIVDGIVPLLGSVRCVGKLAEFFQGDLSEGLNTLRKPVPHVVQRIRESYLDGGALFLTLLAVHAHGSQLGVGRLNQMRKLNQDTEKFWYSIDNIDKKSKNETKINEKLFSSLELKHLYKFAKDNNHLLNLGNNLQRYAKSLDGEYLAENNNVYRFCDGRVYYSFLLVYCEMYSDAIEYCEDNFFFNFVQSSRNTFEDDTNVVLKIDDRKLNIRTRAVMKRFKKEMMLRHISRCMNHPMMSTSFFQLFLKYLGETRHLLWKVLQQQDCDPTEPYSCLYHGMTEEQHTLRDVPRNISEVIITHDIWKKKRKNPKWRDWIYSQESESLVRATVLSNFQTFSLMVEKGAEIQIAALKKAIDVGAEDIINFISSKAVFSRHEWCETKQYAANAICHGTPSQSLHQVLMSLVERSDVSSGDGDIRPLIHYAVQINDDALLKKLVDGEIKCTPVDINQVFEAETPLSAATRLGFQNIVAILLHKNAVQSPNDVFIASTEGHSETLKLLIRENPSSILAEDITGSIPLFYAVSNENYEAVVVLLSEEDRIRKTLIQESEYEDVWQRQTTFDGKKISMLPSIGQCQKRNHERQTALHLAAEKGHTRMIFQLIARGFDVSAEDCNNETPLSLACNGRHTNALRVILNEWNLKGHKQDDKVVMRAVQNGEIDVLEVLIEYGFEINFVSQKYGVPLHLAIQYCMHDMVRFLLSRGADPEIAQDGYRPLHVAAGKGDTESLVLLTDYQASIMEVTGSKKDSILHLATEKKHANFIQRVLRMPDYYPLINMKNVNGETPLHIACKIGCLSLTTLLLEHGFNPKLPSKIGYIPIALAEQGLQKSINSKNMKKWNDYADCVRLLQTFQGETHQTTN